MFDLCGLGWFGWEIGVMGLYCAFWIWVGCFLLGLVSVDLLYWFWFKLGLYVWSWCFWENVVVILFVPVGGFV